MAVTIKDVAKLAGFSTATVSYVVNETRHVSEDKREKVKHAMQELKYFPSALARSLRVQRTRTIGLIVPQLGNQYFTNLAHGIGEILQQNGYSLIISESGDKTTAEEKIIHTFNSLLVDGLIIVPCDPRESDIENVLRGSYPTVFVDRRVDSFKGDAVVLDNFNSTYNAIAMLLDRGRNRIGMLLGAKWYSTTQDRINGYKQAHLDRGMKVDPRLIRHGDYSLESGLVISGNLLEKHSPNAIFSASSEMTLGAFLKARELKYEIPRQIAILGCEDTAWAQATVPALSMIFQPSAELGKKAAELLLKRIESPVDKCEIIFLPTQMRLREST